MKVTGLHKAIQMAARLRQASGIGPLVAKKADQVGALYIYAEIGDTWWGDGGVTASKVRDALAELQGVKTLNVFINSGGGDIFEAKAIHSQLRRFDARKVVHVDGIAASAATFIAMAGDEIITAPSASWMIHEVSGMGFGRSEDMRALADRLETENRVYAETYAARTKQPVDQLLGWMADETWMTAQEAKERGFTDRIAEAETEPEDPKASAAGRLPAVALASETNVRVALARQSQRLHQLSGRGIPANPKSA